MSNYQISDAEWEVMKVLWQGSPVTSSVIIEELKDKTTWKPKTIHTLLRRLVDKGVVKASKNKTFYLYSPNVSEIECKRAETKSFLDKVYDGSFKMLLSNFVKDDNLTPAEIDELQKLLSSVKGEKNNESK